MEIKGDRMPKGKKEGKKPKFLQRFLQKRLVRWIGGIVLGAALLAYPIKWSYDRLTASAAVFSFLAAPLDKEGHTRAQALDDFAKEHFKVPAPSAPPATSPPSVGK